MGLLFYPRGGSSHVAQNLAAALPVAGWDVTIVSGSLSLPGRPGDARTFYAGLDVRPVDFTGALSAWRTWRHSCRGPQTFGWASASRMRTTSGASTTYGGRQQR